VEKAILNVNGKIFTPGEPGTSAEISAFDRSYLYGDSLYEVIRTYHGRMFQMEEHLLRLERSAALCRMVLGQPLEHYRAEIERTHAAFRKLPEMARTEAYCRLVVSRGAGKIGFGLNCLKTPTLYTLYLQPLEPAREQAWEKGMSLRIVERMRNPARALDPAAKTGNYLNSLLGYLEGTAEGFDDALFLDADGHVTEGSTFNVFYVRRGILCTPPLDIGILHGLTRGFLIPVAAQLGIATREARFPRERLYEADEAFVTGTVREIFPVTRVDDRVLSQGRAGPVTRQLMRAFREAIDQQSVAQAS
jgi:branched-chain amino acid aminotransferase